MASGASPIPDINQARPTEKEERVRLSRKMEELPRATNLCNHHRTRSSAEACGRPGHRWPLRIDHPAARSGRQLPETAPAVGESRWLAIGRDRRMAGCAARGPAVTETAPASTFELLTTREASQSLNIPARTLEGWRHRGSGPPYIKVSRGQVRYRAADIESWLEARLIDPARAVGR